MDPELDDPRLPVTFWSKVSVQAPPAHLDDRGPCWLWTGSRTTAGYGLYAVDRRGRAAHKAAYLALVGDVSPGLQLDHLCRRTNCVQVRHLEPVTSKENNRRSREARGIDGTCNKGHSLTATNVTRIGKAREPRCVICQAAIHRAKYVKATGRPDIEWMTTPEAAEATGLPQADVRRLAARGEIAAIQIPAGGRKRRWMFEADSVRRFDLGEPARYLASTLADASEARAS